MADTDEATVRGGRRGRTLPVLQPPDGAGDPRSERRDAAENRRRILATARDLFAARGVGAVSMNAVARAAGIGPGTLYRRYAHKGLLCAALLEENTARFHARFHNAGRARRGAGGEAGAGAALAALLEGLVTFNEENGPLLGAIADAASGERRAVVYDGPFYGWLHDTVAGLLERGVASGEFAPLDTPWQADALLAPLAIDLYLFQRRERGFDAARIAAAAVGTVVRLRATPPSPA